MSIQSLPNELGLHILSLETQQPGITSQVCRRFHAINRHLLSSTLQTIEDPSHYPWTARQIAQIRAEHPDGISNGELCSAFKEKWAEFGRPPVPTLYCSDLLKYEKIIHDEALITIWPSIALALQLELPLVDASAIRAFLNDPANAAQLQSITTLDLSNLKLQVLPNEIGQLTRLTKLDLSENQLTSLPNEIGQLTGLTELNLSDNQLTSLPDVIWQLTGLTHLNLANNQLTSLSNAIENLTELRVLYLFGNKFVFLPDTIWKLNKLQRLDLYGNELTSIPDEIGQLTNLKYLELWDNQFTSLPDAIWKLSKLVELALSQDQLASLPKEIQELIQVQISNLPYATKLYLQQLLTPSFHARISLRAYN